MYAPLMAVSIHQMSLQSSWMGGEDTYQCAAYSGMDALANNYYKVNAQRGGCLLVTSAQLLQSSGPNVLC